MIYQRYVTQPHQGVEYRSLLVDALERHEFERFDGAMAYVTMSGVGALRECTAGKVASRWNALQKRWLVGIDWFRSQPVALDALAATTSGSVRVHDAKRILNQRCVPRIPYHPKTIVLSGEGALAVIAGSGNLSRNGMTAGHEVGSLTIVTKPASAEKAVWDELTSVEQWFAALWKSADPLKAIRVDYERQYESAEHLQSPPPTDDDAGDMPQLTTRRGAMTPAQLKQMRSARHFWIQAGKLTENLGRGKPGNQLMMKRMSRVYFGSPADDVPENTPVGQATIRYQGGTANVYPIRFSDNSMDVMSLPAPGAGGPASYDYETLLFERRSDGAFDLTLLSAAAERAARSRSKAVSGHFQMQGGREYGIY